VVTHDRVKPGSVRVTFGRCNNVGFPIASATIYFPAGTGYNQGENRSAPADTHRPTWDETSTVSVPWILPETTGLREAEECV